MKSTAHILQQSFLQYGLCSNRQCVMSSVPFSTEDFSRCPICDEPQEIPHIFTPSLKQKKDINTFVRYFPKDFVQLFSDAIHLGDDIGNTPLTKNAVLSSWTGIDRLFLKEEQKNPSGSFKDRGTFTAALLLKAKLAKTAFALGTVSTGNMAVSTAFMTNRICENSRIKPISFIIVSSKTPQKKIQAIAQAGGKTGTALFVVDGEYSQFHTKVYEACSRLRSRGRLVYAQLTDDVFRIIGYATLFGEIVEQLQSENVIPDVLILPVASGALFRVAIWTLQSFLQERSIQKMPKVFLVQEAGGDPIVQAYEKKQSTVSPIVLSKDLIADGIDVSYSRSGNCVLELFKEEYCDAVSVSRAEIVQAQKVLDKENIFVEPASAAAVAAAKKLRDEQRIVSSDRVVCVLTGGALSYRNLGNQHASTIVNCSFEDMQSTLVDYFSKEESSTNSQLYYYA